MSKVKTIGITTGGGDCPGLNAVIRAAVKSAVLKHKWKVIGIQDGFDGLIWPEKSRELRLNDVSGILPRGGTILGTTNRGDPFHYKMPDGSVQDISDQIVHNAKKLGIDALIVIGGDGTHVILIPEIKFTIANICKFVEERQASGKRFTIVVVAEGIGMPPDLDSYEGKERRANARSGSMGNVISDAIGNITKREVRVTVLGHIQRGGSPSPFDRILSTRFGVAAVDLISTGDFGRMVCLVNSNVESCDISDAVGDIKLVDPRGDMVHTARAIGVSFGD